MREVWKNCAQAVYATPLSWVQIPRLMNTPGQLKNISVQTTWFSGTYALLCGALVHRKISRSVSVKLQLCPVSTEPTISTTILNKGDL